jgi:glycosyltransferase involved in cell wall biosynthesis
VGGEDHALRIPYLNRLRAKGYGITAVSSGSGTLFGAAGIEHRSFNFDRFSSGYADWRAIFEFRKSISGIKPDIVHSFDTRPNLFVPFVVRRSAAVIRTINGLGWVFSSDEFKAKALRPIYFALQRAASIWTSATVFQNAADLDLFKSHGLLGKSRGHLIGSSGIDTNAFNEAQTRGPSRDQLRKELGLQDAEIILYVGRLTREKGIPSLLEAMPSVMAARPKARLLLVGPLDSEGPFAIDRSAIERLKPYVIALGSRKDVPSLLSIGNLFAFPTEYREGIPRVLLEAGFSGLPIVASNMPGCTDVVTHGLNGLLVPPKNSDALASAIISILSDPARAIDMGTRSIPIVKEKFELSWIMDAYCNIYDGVASRKSLQAPIHDVVSVGNNRVKAWPEI